MKICDRYDVELMNVSLMKKKGEDLIMKGTMMGHIPTSVYLKPEEMWNAIKLLSWSVILYTPFMLLKGWRKAATNGKQTGV